MIQQCLLLRMCLLSEGEQIKTPLHHGQKVGVKDLQSTPGEKVKLCPSPGSQM